VNVFELNRIRPEAMYQFLLVCRYLTINMRMVYEIFKTLQDESVLSQLGRDLPATFNDVNSLACKYDEGTFRAPLCKTPFPAI
jgi:hypothetical protein